jgi:hypothetical protein
MPVASRWSLRVLPGRGLSPVGSTVTSRNPEAYCQYTETAAVADAVSQVVAAGRRRERGGTQVLGPAVPMTLVSIAQSGTTVTIGGITREI